MSELINEGEFATAIDIIADKLGIAVTEIFEIFVNAQAAIGVITIATIFAVVLTCMASYFVAMKYISGKYTYSGVIKKLEDKDSYVDPDDKIMCIIVPLLVVMVIFFISAIMFDCVGDCIIRIICPEYSAITEIITIVKP